MPVGIPRRTLAAATGRHAMAATATEASAATTQPRDASTPASRSFHPPATVTARITEKSATAAIAVVSRAGLTACRGHVPGTMGEP